LGALRLTFGEVGYTPQTCPARFWVRRSKKSYPI